MMFGKIRKSLENSFNVESIIIRQLKIQQYQQYAYDGKEMGIDEKGNVIVSLTTYNKRIKEVFLTIESLFRQTQKAKQIILWLSKDEFNENNIPIILKKQQERGLEIRFCEDLKSYKKLIPTLRTITNYIIITTDDDCIYPRDFIENIFFTHLKFPYCVCYYRGTKIKLNKNGHIMPYITWEEEDSEYLPSYLNFATGLGGILYPPNSLYKDITQESIFQTLAPKADDIWFKAMEIMQKTKCVKVKIECDFEQKFISLTNSQDISLWRYNVVKGENDKQIKAVFEKYNINLKIIE